MAALADRALLRPLGCTPSFRVRWLFCTEAAQPEDRAGARPASGASLAKIRARSSRPVAAPVASVRRGFALRLILMAFPSCGLQGSRHCRWRRRRSSGSNVTRSQFVYRGYRRKVVVGHAHRRCHTNAQSWTRAEASSVLSSDAENSDTRNAVLGH